MKASLSHRRPSSTKLAQKSVQSPRGKGTSQSLQRAKSVLERAGLRITQPRELILKVLTAGHGPYSVDEVRTLAGAKDLDRVTTHRCLLAFEELGLVRRCELGDSISRYEWVDEDHHHHHVVCKKCRKMQVVELCVPPSLIRTIQKLGYESVTHSLEFFGLCKKCV